jgi:ubiquinone/menaquinone biosynthesis C-methylase UbiE
MSAFIRLFESFKTIRIVDRILSFIKRPGLPYSLHLLIFKLRCLAPWNDVTPSRVVEKGYDRIADRYAEWASSVHITTYNKYKRFLFEALPPLAEVLELGCGSGIPITQELAKHFTVTGVDISSNTIALARQNVPDAKFIHSDMTKLDFSSERFDAVLAFYSIIHVPRKEQPVLLRKISSWLRPGGLFIATMGTRSADIVFYQDWLGVPMYWSTFDAAVNKRLVEDSGLKIIWTREETEDIYGRLVTFLWIKAEKPHH